MAMHRELANLLNEAVDTTVTAHAVNQICRAIAKLAGLEEHPGPRFTDTTHRFKIGDRVTVLDVDEGDETSHVGRRGRVTGLRPRDEHRYCLNVQLYAVDDLPEHNIEVHPSELEFSYPGSVGAQVEETRDA